MEHQLPGGIFWVCFVHLYSKEAKRLDICCNLDLNPQTLLTNRSRIPTLSMVETREEDRSLRSRLLVDRPKSSSLILTRSFERGALIERLQESQLPRASTVL